MTGQTINLNGGQATLTLLGQSGEQLLATISSGCSPASGPVNSKVACLSDYEPTDAGYRAALNDADIVIADVSSEHVTDERISVSGKRVLTLPGVTHTVAHSGLSMAVYMGDDSQWDVSINGNQNISTQGRIIWADGDGVRINSKFLTNSDDPKLNYLIALRGSAKNFVLDGTKLMDSNTLVSITGTPENLTFRNFMLSGYRARGIFGAVDPNTEACNVVFEDFEIGAPKLNPSGTSLPNEASKQPIALQAGFQPGTNDQNTRGTWKNVVYQRGVVKLPSEPWMFTDQFGNLGTSDALSIHRARGVQFKEIECIGGGENHMVATQNSEDILMEDILCVNSDLHGPVIGAIALPTGVTAAENQCKRTVLRNIDVVNCGIDAAQDHPGGPNFLTNFIAPGGRAGVSILNCDDTEFDNVNVGNSNRASVTPNAMKYGVTGQGATNVSGVGTISVEGATVQDIAIFTGGV